MIIAIGLYQGFTALDAIGPYEVLTYLPAEVVICAEKPGMVDDHNDLVHLRVDATFADVPRPDVLFVPGGPVAGQYAADGHPIVDWIRQAHPHTTWTTSVCTGALLLGRRRTGGSSEHSARYRIRSSAPIRRRFPVEGAKSDLQHGDCGPRRLTKPISRRQPSGATVQPLPTDPESQESVRY